MSQKAKPDKTTPFISGFMMGSGLIGLFFAIAWQEYGFEVGWTPLSFFIIFLLGGAITIISAARENNPSPKTIKQLTLDYLDAQARKWWEQLPEPETHPFHGIPWTMLTDDKKWLIYAFYFDRDNRGRAG